MVVELGGEVGGTGGAGMAELGWRSGRRVSPGGPS